MIFIVCSNFAAVLFGSYAIYKQNLAAYSTVFVINAVFGALVFASHCMGNPKV